MNIVQIMLHVLENYPDDFVLEYWPPSEYQQRYLLKAIIPGEDNGLYLKVCGDGKLLCMILYQVPIRETWTCPTTKDRDWPESSKELDILIKEVLNESR